MCHPQDAVLSRNPILRPPGPTKKCYVSYVRRWRCSVPCKGDPKSSSCPPVPLLTHHHTQATELQARSLFPVSSHPPMVSATPAVLLSVFCTGAVDRMGSSPRPTLACLSPHTDLQREGLQCLLSASRSFLPACLSRLLVCRTRSRDVQGYGKFLVFRDSHRRSLFVSLLGSCPVQLQRAGMFWTHC